MANMLSNGEIIISGLLVATLMFYICPYDYATWVFRAVWVDSSSQNDFPLLKKT